ncbi:SIR2 family protein [Arthrobacter bambusae]
MWIGDLDVPRGLIDAGRDGELVLFIGAGASMASPSGLPGFVSLAQGIAERASKPFKKKDRKRLDAYLGRLEDEGVKVRDLAAERLDNPESSPNSLHRAIVALATTCPSIRVVTTNFDRYLSQAFADQKVKVDEYAAPALPMGDDFEGIVYLHGHLQQPVRRLVLTDKDFGAAYLQDAWAARFLERMFRARTVLFIGYSHGDVVMQYFARALGRNQQRYTLTDEPDKREWQSLGIIPVGYKLNGKSHDALPIMLEKWARQASMKHLEQAEYVREIVSRGIPAKPEELAYIEETLADPERIRYFTEAAKSIGWFRWAASRPEFSRLIAPVAHDEIALALARWVAHGFVRDEELSGDAIEIMSVLPWSPMTWRCIVHAGCISTTKNGAPEWLKPWIALLVERDPGSAQDPGGMLTTLLSQVSRADDQDTALLLLDHLMRPQLVPLPRFRSTGPSRFEVRLRGDTMQLPIIPSGFLQRLRPQHLPALMNVADHHLREAYRLQRAANQGMTLDVISYRRISISGAGSGAIDELVDLARDLLIRALESHPALAQQYIESWADSEETILARLALHGWCYRADQNSSQKISWLASRKWLYRFGIQQEVYRLLETALPDAGQGEVLVLLTEALGGPQDDSTDPERNERLRFDMVGRLAIAAPDDPSVKQAFTELKDKYPDWAVDIPSRTGSHASGNPFERQASFTIEQLHEWIQADPSDAADRIQADEAVQWGGPRAEDAIRVVEQCVTLHANDGLALLPNLVDRLPAAVGAIIQGWAEASLDTETADDVLKVLATLDLKKVGSTIAWLLTSGVRDAESTPWHGSEAARALAERVCDALEESKPPVGDNLFLESVTSTEGRLAEFWIRAVSHDWRQAGEKWNGLTARHAKAIEALLSGQASGDRSCAVFASELHFFHGADRDWTGKNLLPLFVVTADSSRSFAAWNGFLEGAAPADALTEQMLPLYLEAASQEQFDSDQLRPRLGYHLAWITLFSSTDPLGWLRRFSVDARPGIRVSWARNVAWNLRRLEVSAVDREWSRWMGVYWSERVATAEVPIGEASAMAEWVPRLMAQRSEAIGLVVQCPADISQTDNLLYEVSQADLSDRPGDWIKFLLHLLKDAKQLTNWMHLKEIVQKLDSLDPRPDAEPLVEEALRLKVNDDPKAWLST